MGMEGGVQGMNKAIYETLDLFASRKTSRRDFIQALTALGVTSLAAESLSASFQQDMGTPAGSPQTGPPVMAEGPAGAVLLEQLKAMGLKYIFHTNTSGLDTITDAVVDSDVEILMVTHEGQAISAAEGYALAGGTMPFFMGSQVGVGNAISNIYNAWKDRTPMLVTFGRSALGGQGGRDSFEEWDQHLMPTDSFSAWHWSCVDAVSIPEVARRAVKFAHTPPGAPVTLDFPDDLLAQRIRAPIYSMDPKQIRPVFRATPALMVTAARWLAESQTPVFIVGPEISRGGAHRAIIALAEKLAVPVCQEDDLFCDFPTSHPLFLGRYSTQLRFPQNVDLVISFGAKIGGVHRGARLVHVSTDSDSIGRTNEVDLPILAHVSTVIPEISDALDGLLTGDRIRRIREERWEAASGYTALLRRSHEETTRYLFDQVPLSWGRVGHELERVLDRNAVIVPEMGSRNQMLGYLSQGIDDKWRFGRTKGSALGWGVGAAFGVQLALPDRQVVCIQGDGGFLFGQTETLWTISRYDAPILIVVMNNHCYNETRSRNLGGAGRQFQTGQELTSFLGDPHVDFTKIGEAYSIKGAKVGNPDELTAALQTAVETMRDGRPFILDVEVAPDGVMSETTWHPYFSIAQEGNRRPGSSWLEEEGRS